MSQVAFEKPVEDTVPKINKEVAVGEDLAFQRRWWSFERGIWIFFALLLVADLAGVFGRGPLAKAHLSNSAMTVEYERVARAQTPSVLRIHFAPEQIQNGHVHLYVSESIVNRLGAQRVIPAPESSVVGQNGITYSFPASTAPASVAFALQPENPGSAPFTLQVPGTPALQGRVIILP